MSVQTDFESRYYRQSPASAHDFVHIVRELLGSILKPVQTFFAHWQRRRRFLKITELDQRQLDDIGVTLAEVERAAQLPLHMNAGVILQEESRARRRAYMRRRIRG